MKYSFFYCNVFDSPILSWEINRDGIGVFRNGNLDVVFPGITSSYNYSASLLSLRNTKLGETVFDSVLIVSAPLGLPVHVNCVGDHGSKNTSNLATPMNNDNFSPQNRLPVLMMMPIILNSTIITDAKTRAFMCASNGTGDQTWETDFNDHLAFDPNSRIGTSTNRLANSRDTLRLQAISLGLVRGNFVSILYVTDDSVSQVRCISGPSRVEYPTDFITPATTVKGMLLYLILSRFIVLSAWDFTYSQDGMLTFVGVKCLGFYL